MVFESQPIAFSCQGSTLRAVIEEPSSDNVKGVIVVVGGPQYRVGSHRQFVLLSRYLATHGYPVLRFDHRGIGDSEGATTFDALDSDISAAIDELQRRLPGVREIVLWGLCDGASAAMMYAAKDPRVVGLVLLNPWVRSEQTYAQSHISGYYAPLLVSGAFWKRLLTGEIDVLKSARSFCKNFYTAFSKGRSQSDPKHVTFQDRMLQGIRAFDGKTLFILSGQDLTAREFSDLVSRSRSWQTLNRSALIKWQRIESANHTFSTKTWRDQVADLTLNWIRSL